MGLDTQVYKLMVDQDQIEHAMKQYIEMDGYSYLDHNVRVISKYEQLLWSVDNKRIIDLFEHFKDHVKQYTMKDVIDYPELAKRYGELKDFEINYRNSLSSNYAEFVKDIRGIVDENHPNDRSADLFNLYENSDGVIHNLSDSDIPRKDIVDDILFFKETLYCRKTHKQSIYNSFIGDCWYEDDKSGLDEIDVRIFVYSHEMDELKTHFEGNSDIQNWNLTPDEIVYLSA